ncbi:MAG TPA: hypothetical protein VGK36_19350 [Candidatus Angelobacter sp.]|jgi:hypothetical protein
MDTIDPEIPRGIASPRSPRLISRKIKLTALAISIFLFYGIGIFVRSNRGIRVIVQNESETSLNDANVILEYGDPYLLGDIAAGKTKKAFIVPSADSRIRFEFAAQKGQGQSEIVAGYVENGYCGDVTVRVLPDLRVKTLDESFAVWNWKSWYGFL